jgi:hypothetical protein
VTEVYETGRPAEVDVDSVTSRDEVVGVLRAMINDLRKHPDDWQNATLDEYLDALAASLEDVEDAEPSWHLMAEVLVAASGYE